MNQETEDLKIRMAEHEAAIAENEAGMRAMCVKMHWMNLYQIFVGIISALGFVANLIAGDWMWTLMFGGNTAFFLGMSLSDRYKWKKAGGIYEHTFGESSLSDVRND